MELQGKTILITGASSGIGRACALAFARSGCHLLLTGRSTAELEKTATEAGGNAKVLAADLTNAEDMKNCRQWASGQAPIDVLLNNAGVGVLGPITEVDPALVRRMFELNLFAPLELTQALLPSIPRGGLIVNVASIVAEFILPSLVAYAASKAALRTMSDGMRMELAPRGIGVLCVLPGYVKTPFLDHALSGSVGPRVAKQEFQITPERCAADIVDAVRRGKQSIVTPPILWSLVAAARIAPRLVYGRMARLLKEKSVAAG